MNGFKHGRYFSNLPLGTQGKRVPVEMHHTSLPEGYGMELTQTLNQAQTLFRDEQFYAA